MLNLKISQKLPLIMVALVLLSTLPTGFVAYEKALGTLTLEKKSKLMALMLAKRESLNSYLKTIDRDLRFQSRNPFIFNALKEFNTAWKKLGADAGATLQRLYIEENFFPVGNKEEFSYAPDGSDYSEVHAKYHPAMRQFLRDGGYYDAFLVNVKGDIVYSALKEPDYATNALTGPWKDTGLGRSVRAVLDQPWESKVSFIDFKSYGPSHDAPASFIARGIFDAEGTLKGALAFQISVKRTNQVMQSSAGLGRSGETYLVGQDKLMRSDSRFSKTPTILRTKIDTPIIDLALKGQTGVKEGPDYRGVETISAYGMVDFYGVPWAVITQIDKIEALQSVYRFRSFLLIWGLVLVVGAGSVGIFVARRISSPIAKMADAMHELVTGGKSVEIPGVRRTDEIGVMASAVQVFKDDMIENEKSAEARKREDAERRDHLEALVEERTSEVQRQSVQLEVALAQEKQNNAIQREFVAMVSHEFRTPLAIIDGAAQRVARRIEKATTEELLKRMDKIRNAVVRMTDLIDGTLSTARIDAGTFEKKNEPVDLKPLVADVCRRQQEITPDYVISIDMEGVTSPVWGDPKLLDQIFTNLLSNAVKFSPDDRRVEVMGAMENDFVLAVSVRDHGVGIPEAELPKLFTRYFRASTSSGIAGTGIGLSLVKEFIGMHDGRIDVISKEGEGSTFTIRLPVYQEAPKGRMENEDSEISADQDMEAAAAD